MPDPAFLDQEHQLETVSEIRSRAQQAIGSHQRRIEVIGARIGQPRTLYILTAVVCVWCLVNGLARSFGMTPFDPAPFFWLQGAASLYAAVISTVVLTTQNRQAKHTEQRAYLELHVNLLAERKTAKIIHLLEELRRDMPSVRDRVDHEANHLQRAADTEAVLSALTDALDDTNE